ncbi:MAG: lytic transglycosylase [Rhodobacteraceae bacterium]|nr:MAG: lytic transglycosylase [Paracoccaceae bacterium]
MRAVTTTRALGAVVIALALAGCASRSRAPAPVDTQPRNVANICAIFDEKPHWAQAARAAEQRWGTPQHVKMAIIWRESTFRPNVRPPRFDANGRRIGYASSAYGFPQAIDGTWAWYQRETGNMRAQRSNFADAIDFVGWYMNKTRHMNGVGHYDAFRHYLNYHEGHTGYVRGRWRSNPSLQTWARQVEAQAALYSAQLARCGRTRVADAAGVTGSS